MRELTAVRVGITNLKRWRASFIEDRRGAAAFEMLIVYPFLILGILMPLADLAIAGFQYISARQALHALGQYLMYSPPDDLADSSTWETAARAKGASLGYTISSIQLICGDNGAVCPSADPGPKYYTYSTSVTLSPLVLTSVLCPDSCTFTISYSTRFQ